MIKSYEEKKALELDQATDADALYYLGMAYVAKGKDVKKAKQMPR